MNDPAQALALRAGALLLVAALVLATWGGLRAWGAYRRGQALRTSPVPELSQGKPTILLFTGILCSDCHTQKEIINTVLNEMVDGWRVQEIQAARDVRAARRFGVESVPATVVIDAGGRPRAVNYGLVEAGALSRQLRAG